MHPLIEDCPGAQALGAISDMISPPLSSPSSCADDWIVVYSLCSGVFVFFFPFFFFPSTVSDFGLNHQF